jgi:hypothetical protein
MLSEICTATDGGPVRSAVGYFFSADQDLRILADPSDRLVALGWSPEVMSGRVTLSKSVIRYLNEKQLELTLVILPEGTVQGDKIYLSGVEYVRSRSFSFGGHERLLRIARTSFIGYPVDLYSRVDVGGN